MTKNILSLLLLCVFSTLSFSQTAPSNTRLFQLNTVRGSELSLVELSDNFAYHIGTMNSSEVGFDGLSATSVGLDDLFILKSDATGGSNVWFKTFNAGANGIVTPRYVSVDAAENLYVFGQFKGSLTAGAETVTSANPNDAFLMKINPGGNAVWVQYFENGYNSLSRTKVVSDGVDTFIVNNNKLTRLNDQTGTLIFEKNYGAEIQSVALRNSDLYISGAANLSDVVLGSEIISYRTAFIVKGDKNANFTAACKTSEDTISPVISEITFGSDEKLIFTGFNKSALNLIAGNQTVSYTYNPNASFDYNKLYYFTAKIDANLQTVDFFRSSGAFSRDAGSFPRADFFSSKLIATSAGFNLLISANDRNRIAAGFTNSNSSITTPDPASANLPYSFLLQSDNAGNYVGGAQPLFYGFKLSSNKNQYSETIVLNKRVFVTSIRQATTGSQMWTKAKNAAVGGTFSYQFQKHLSSAKSDMFVTALAEGSANFFGKQYGMEPGMFSRAVTRLGADGLPKWFATFTRDCGKGELGISGDFAAVDKYDNLLLLANLGGYNSSFTDAAGTVVNFTAQMQPNEKVLIKVDKEGLLLWTKQFAGSESLRASVTTDGNGDVYIVGDGGFMLDGHQMQGNLSMVKLGAAGDYIYGKSYDVGIYSFIPVFDAQNNLYVFSEPINYSGDDYVFDGITIPTNSDHTDHLMLKFNNSGNVIWGKNFYANSANYNYAWPNDVVFDGSDFVVMGNYFADKNTDFVGLDLLPVPRIYPNVTYMPFVAKVSTAGNVIWQEPFHTSQANTGAYTNIELDENKNVYSYFYAKDKLNLNGTEYTFDAVSGNKVLMKLDTSGNLKYFKPVDFAPYGSNFIDVMGNDKINVTGFTTQDNLLNYPIAYNRASSMYIATFGDLDTYYLTPTKDYLQLNNITIGNDPDNSNTFSFDLLNNVDWIAGSDQSWLNLSFMSLTEKNNFKNSINGNGDAKIIMLATANVSGVDRTANVMISGTGVSSKTIAVTQSRILASGETKAFVTTLYPNPTSDILNIETQQKISKIAIFDLSGKLVISADGKAKNVSVSNLMKGMYLIKIYTESGVVNSKFIKN
ncbi:T9SS type A sorting domain-containing protein [Kaistella palustris]|uniref:T9SS type A sorting domain-containing protein n=1 Tax=Kaistella palustris TaxID=493376 RepID=UPI000423F500|nr:T9SS type A sorting domain-containing protein [Kaistella palustris]